MFENGKTTTFIFIGGENDQYNRHTQRIQRRATQDSGRRLSAAAQKPQNIKYRRGSSADGAWPMLTHCRLPPEAPLVNVDSPRDSYRD